MTHLQINVVKNTRHALAAAMHIPADNWERHLARLVLADFDEAVERADADEFAPGNAIGRLCAAYEKAVC